MAKLSNNLLKYFMTISLILLSNIPIHSAQFRILQEHMLDIYPSNIKTPYLDSIVINKVDSIQKSQCTNSLMKMLYHYPEISQRYEIKKLNNVILYHLEPESVVVINNPFEIYFWVLVNAENHYIYHFCDDISDFCKVICGNLSIIYDSDKDILDFIEFS